MQKSCLFGEVVKYSRETNSKWCTYRSKAVFVETQTMRNRRNPNILQNYAGQVLGVQPGPIE